MRSFRSTLLTAEFDRITDVWPAFNNFLINFPHTEADELDHLRRMVAVELDKLSMIHVNFIFETVVQKRRPRGERSEDRVRAAIAERRGEAEAASIEGFLTDKTEDEFIDRYGPTIDSIANIALKAMDLNASLRRDIYGLFWALVRSRVRTDAFTGFVFAGFGKSDLFPTLHSIEVDGIYLGSFRVIRDEVTDIDRRGDTAAIVPFAQTDMAERFIFGIDKFAEDALEKIMMSMVGDVLTARPRTFPAVAREQLLEAARARFQAGVQKLKTQSEQNLKSVVDHLSKKELADVAYSLVELTSRKRRYSSDPETVGGPIDVAILTRNEGFIWVRRKHYFDAELNPAFFNRIR